MICETGGCQHEALVGWGSNPITWLCMTHFNEALADVGRTIDEAVELLTRRVILTKKG